MFDLVTDGDYARLTLSGDVDLQTTADLKHDIANLNSIRSLEVHAGEVSYIDSSGVAVLLYARQLCLQRQVSFAIPIVSQPLFRILELAHLQTILPIGQVVDGPDIAGDDTAFLSVPGSVGTDLDDFLPPETAIDAVPDHQPLAATSTADLEDHRPAGPATIDTPPVSQAFDIDTDALPDQIIKPGDFG